MVAPIVPQVKEEPASAVPKWEQAVKLLNIRGIMTAAPGQYMAMINNQIVKEQDTVTAVFEKKRYRWKVYSISKSGVRFEPRDVEPIGGPPSR